MKIKHLLIINFFLILIIFVNFVIKNDNKKYIFERKFTENKIEIVKNYDLRKVKYYTASSHQIALYNKQSDSGNICIEGKLLNLNPDFSINSTFKFSVIPDSNPVILNISKKYLLYTLKWKLYINNILLSDRISVANALFYNENQILFLGEYQDKDGYNFEFFLFDLKSKTIEKIQVIKNDSVSYFPKYFLQYDGTFKKFGNEIVYVNKYCRYIA